MKKRIAAIDLGTNTFHLLIAEISGNTLHILHKEKASVKIGEGGISKGFITIDAAKRALYTLEVFKTMIDRLAVNQIKGVATSAIRNARNGQQLLASIQKHTGIHITTISGKQEAELIYYGVKAAMYIPSAPQLIMDIGGGSVEFIVGNSTEILWKESFEIGAQRMLDRFHHTDPIPAYQVQSLNKWLSIKLKILLEAIQKYKPKGLIGCSGSFDTLTAIYLKQNNDKRKVSEKVFNIPVYAFDQIYEELIIKNREERLQIPGMAVMRVDMIVVACCLIRFVSGQLGINTITACTYALKEGLVFKDHQEKTIEEEIAINSY